MNCDNCKQDVIGDSYCPVCNINWYSEEYESLNTTETK